MWPPSPTSFTQRLVRTKTRCSPIWMLLLTIELILLLLESSSSFYGDSSSSLGGLKSKIGNVELAPNWELNQATIIYCTRFSLSL